MPEEQAPHDLWGFLVLALVVGGPSSIPMPRHLDAQGVWGASIGLCFSRQPTPGLRYHVWKDVLSLGDESAGVQGSMNNELIHLLEPTEFTSTTQSISGRGG